MLPRCYLAAPWRQLGLDHKGEKSTCLRDLPHWPQESMGLNPRYLRDTALGLLPMSLTVRYKARYPRQTCEDSLGSDDPRPRPPYLTLLLPAPNFPLATNN